MKNYFSPLEKKRLSYQPTMPKIFHDLSSVDIEEENSQVIENQKDLKKIFVKTYDQKLLSIKHKNKKIPTTPIKVAVVFSGGQASGGHNVIAGLYDALMELNKNNILLGFLNGPIGMVENKTITIDKKLLSNYRNLGGFNLIGSGRTKIEEKEELEKVLENVKKLKLDGIIIIGGDDSNTNAAIIAEYFLQNNCLTRVIGVPKTIDGDLRNAFLPVSFGFDTACKIYSEMIGNLQIDALSAKKYYHFVKLMGRSASHIALECALRTQPNYVLISEEVFLKKMTLNQVVQIISDIICIRSEKKKNYGVILIPEGLIEFVLEMQELITELNSLLAHGENESLLSDKSKKFYNSLPKSIQEQLLLNRDPHGNVQVSQIETEKLLSEMVRVELEKRKKTHNYQGKFNPLHHFFGYEGRCGMPSNFDAQYCYSLGFLAALLISRKATGYMACIYDLHKPIEEWQAKGVPLISLMNVEKRKGKDKPVIKKALVDMDSYSYKTMINKIKIWIEEDCYLNPGPIQFEGNKNITDSYPYSIK